MHGAKSKHLELIRSGRRSVLSGIHPIRQLSKKGGRQKNWRKRVGVEPTHRGLDRYTGFEAQEGHRNPITHGFPCGPVDSSFGGFIDNSYLAHAFGPVEEAGPDSEEPQ